VTRVVAPHDALPGSRREPGPAERRANGKARLGRRLRTAKAAVAQLHDDALQVLSLRRQRVANRVRSVVWSIVGAAAMAFVAIVVASTASVMAMLGAAWALAELLGTSTAVGFLIVGFVVLLLIGLALAHARQPRNEPLAANEAALRASMRGSTRSLLRAVGTLPALGLTALGGFLAVRVMRHAQLRRLAVLAFSMVRAADRASRAKPPAGAPRTPAGDLAGTGVG
jgi:hypothetical protein